MEATLDRAGRRDVVLLHEQELSRALRLLQVCSVQLILVDSRLPGGSLDETLRALRLQAPGTPIAVLQAEPLKMHWPCGVHAVVRRREAQGLLAILGAILK